MPALYLACKHVSADSFYLLSDGLVDDATDVVSFVDDIIVQQEQQIKIHTVGFFPHVQSDHHGEKFLRHLAEATRGTYQVDAMQKKKSS